jgi:glycosyltransferase involved in cell wall biosynthesis
LQQTLKDFELLIICDGTPKETVISAEKFSKVDSRIKVFSYEKGKRHGEHYRHLALETARGHYVAQIADDDLWFPNHLEVLFQHLQGTDFVNTLHCSITEDEDVHIHFADLADQRVQQRMKSQHFNLFGPTFVGYTLNAYRSLPEGWSPSPESIWSDLWMWRKFLNCTNLKFKTEFQITGISFPSPLRSHLSMSERCDEINEYWDKLNSPNFQQSCRDKMMIKLAKERTGHIAKIKELERTIQS